jgi:hypothetical protein
MKKKELTSIFILLMQSYGDSGLIPRKCTNSSSSCVDKGSIFGQIEVIDPKVVQQTFFS